MKNKTKIPQNVNSFKMQYKNRRKSLGETDISHCICPSQRDIDLIILRDQRRYHSTSFRLVNLQYHQTRTLFFQVSILLIERFKL